MKELESGYREFMDRGADVIETDIPVPLSKLLLEGRLPPEKKKGFFRIEK